MGVACAHHHHTVRSTTTPAATGNATHVLQRPLESLVTLERLPYDVVVPAAHTARDEGDGGGTQVSATCTHVNAGVSTHSLLPTHLSRMSSSFLANSTGTRTLSVSVTNASPSCTTYLPHTSAPRVNREGHAVRQTGACGMCCMLYVRSHALPHQLQLARRGEQAVHALQVLHLVVAQHRHQAAVVHLHA